MKEIYKQVKLLSDISKNQMLRWQIIVLASIYGAYSLLNLLRTTIVIVSPALLEDPSINLNKTMWGGILGWGTAGTLLGKLTTGLMADKFGGRKVFLFSIGLCMFSTWIFGMVSNYYLFSLAFFIAMLAKSAGWPSIANLIKNWYPKIWFGRVWGILSSSSMSSSFFTSILMGTILITTSWRFTVTVSLPIVFSFSILLFFYLKQSPADVTMDPYYLKGDKEPIYSSKKNHFLDNFSVKAAIKEFLGSSRFWLICVSIMCLTILMAFQGFIPICLKENFNISSGQASLASSVFPLGSMFSVLIGGFIYDKLTKKNRITALGLMMLLATGCVFVLLLLIKSKRNDSDALFLALSVIMVYGLMIAPCYLIPMSVFSVDFGGKHCGLLIGIIDATGYFASMIFEFYGGVIADRLDGWFQLLYIIFCTSILGTIALVTFLFIDFRVFIKKDNLIK